ncbi:MAG: type II secretion system minor pseudopilin GspK, partial [Xanthomonadales bacterium]|nr:type II secretion system minor pseudopilin GspK [Xanthomonadales bacterium]
MMAHRQRGVALLVALLVVALASLLIASLLDSGQLSLARSRNLLRGEQANAYAQGLEAYAAKVLVDDSNQGNDSNSDSWAVPMPPTPVPGGVISGTLREMNGCFNLNNLLRGEQPAPEWIKRFRRLLLNLQLQPAIANAVVDWIDNDQTTADSGAEDGGYLGRQPAYRTSGRPFTSVTELRLVAGVDAHTYNVLAPYVCALPTPTTLNLNTASVPVLMSLASGMTQSVAARVYNSGHANYT